MALPIADGILFVGLAYAIIGVMVSAAFLLFGIEDIDPAARHSYFFRALIAPGLALLWPVVIKRWHSNSGGTRDTPVPHPHVHVAAWICLAVVLPLLLVIAFWQSHVTIPETPSVRLSLLEIVN
jgi:hypothetical protein